MRRPPAKTLSPALMQIYVLMAFHKASDMYTFFNISFEAANGKEVVVVVVVVVDVVVVVIFVVAS